MEKINLDKIKAFCKSAENLHIWGAGSFGEQVYTYLSKNGFNIKSFIDSDENKQNKFIVGIEIIGIKKLLTIIGENDCIIICSTYAKIIEEELINNGLLNYIIFPIDQLLNLDFDEYYIQNKSRFDKFIECLDADSKLTFESAIKFKRTGDYNQLVKSEFPQYFHPNVSPSNGDVIIDGGAFIGDTVEAFNKALESDCIIHSFELTERNFQLLNKTIEKHNFKNVHANHFGLGGVSENVFMNYDPVNPAGSKITEYGNNVTQIITIDDYVAKNNISKLDNIKLDIEGFELAALRGACSTIERFQPKLQVCIYHKNEDLIEIYEYISNQFKHLNYQFFVGHHSDNVYETVLYASV